VAEAYRPDAEDGGRRLALNLAPASTIGDRELILHAVANLLDNGLRHTPSGACIRLSTGERNGRPYICVADDGPGVPEAHRTKVLERFFRLEGSRTTTGSGLGLAIVAAIAGRHQAELELCDAAPGLEVRLTFPSAHAPRVARAARPASTANPSKTKALEITAP
jgi:signal transduction histidine kinase